ncbi:MAG: arginine--tRNA ligase, partial [Hafnia sp.]
VNVGCTLSHMAFGTMNGKDGRPFRSRDGGTVKLAELLDTAEQRALDLVMSKNPDMERSEAWPIAKAVAVASVKYADLSKHREGDYVFDFDQMLSFDGNTAPYLLYAYTRCAGIFRKLNISMESNNSVRLVAEQEIDLGKKLVSFGDVLNEVGANGTPHTLCTYLYEVAGLFSSFYEHCPITSSDVDAETQGQRLALVAFTGKTLKAGLELLGIKVLERM